MLAGRAAHTDKLSYPLLASVKLDGIRAVVREGVLLSRNLKPIPNKHLQALFGKRRYDGLDGELVVGDPTAKTVFRETTSGVMSVEGTPPAAFHVFDCFRHPELPFAHRQNTARNALGPHCIWVRQSAMLSLKELLWFEEIALGQGYEGVMIRSPFASYKYGRGTERAQDLLKLKRFEDAEAVVLGFEDQQLNTNPATLDALGRVKRSTQAAGLQGKGTLGALCVRGLNGTYVGVPYSVGTGFSDTLRAEIWAHRADWVGRVVKVKYFPLGSKDAPRFPVFLGERSPADL